MADAQVRTRHASDPLPTHPKAQATALCQGRVKSSSIYRK